MHETATFICLHYCCKFSTQLSFPSIAMVHFLLVAFPTQGHINPALQFAKRLIGAGAQVTFATSVFAHKKMLNNSTPFAKGLTFAPISDGYDDGFDRRKDDPKDFITTTRRHGKENLAKLLLQLANEGRPVTCLIHTLLLSWAAEVAMNLDIPSTILWIQPATVFDIYYYYFHGYKDLILGNNADPSYLIELPGLPPLTCRDIPSFLLPESCNPYAFVLEMFKEQFDVLERMGGKQKKIRVLVNSFDALEPEAMTAVEKVNLIGIGPLIPSAFLDCKDPSDTCFGGDLTNASKDEKYMSWLNSQEESSVIYISFGTIVVLDKRQTEEISRALFEIQRPFLWVIRISDNDEEKEKEEMVADLVRKHEQQGLIVPWCSQVEVLSHPSVGCFVSHCGWNSTLESMVTGVPVVAFPQWTDQGTNAKLIEDVSRTGVRVKANEDKILESEEFKRCLEMVMGDEGKEIKMNAKKWKNLGRKAVEEGGSSDTNLRSFIEEFGL